MEDNKAVGIGSALVVLVIGAGIYFYKFAATVPAPAEPPIEAPASGPAAAAVPGEPLPKLEESDAFVRARTAALSSDPTFAAWLKTDDLLSRFAAAVNMVAKGKVPKDGLSFMGPHKKFKARKRDDAFFAEPGSYARYDAVAGAVASLDAAAAVKLFQRCKPLFQQAYSALGEQGDVQGAFVAAAGELLKAPPAGSSVALREKGIVYAYADDSLESRSPAQKQLMRMGPKNQEKVQAKLRDLLSALGVPAPPPAK